MNSSKKGDATGSQDDSLIDAARREIFGDADPASSAVVLSGGTDGKGTATSDGDERPSAKTRRASDSDVRTFTRIAQYHINGTIGSGGLGTVFKATQEHPRRTVAVKVMKHGIASPRALRRFEHESQILGELRHPGIAQVYEAGWHEEGDTRLPFFAMEYILHAESITGFAKRRQLSVEDRIRLFVSVCHAIGYSHERGVIHRDIKPDNILVDSSGQVKVIDFGVARSTDLDMNQTSQQTMVGDCIGTYAYMSPEQYRADPEDFGIRSDIYSLGMVLFELLAGRAPYDLKAIALVDIPKMICEEPPQRLGTIDRSLRGDPEIIVHKALEKESRYRYETVSDLAEDLERFLRNEPILARPPSALYRFRKLVRRRRVPLTAATLLVVLGIVVTAANIRLAGMRRENLRLADEVALLAATAPFFDFQAQPVRRAQVFDLCNRVLAFDEQNASALALRARVYFLRGDYQAAGRDCLATLAIEPENALAMRTCAFVRLNDGDFAAARRLYEAAMSKYALTTDLPRDFHNRARLRRLSGEYAGAMVDHDRAVALAPTHGLARKGRGVTRYMSGDIEGAIEDLTRAASLSGNRGVQCHLWIWEIHALPGAVEDHEEADRAIRRAAAAAADPHAKGLIKVLRGQRDAETHLATLKQPDDIAQAHYYLGVKAMIEQRPEDAVGHFRKATDPSLKGGDEYDLARWHLARLGSE